MTKRSLIGDRSGRGDETGVLVRGRFGCRYLDRYGAPIVPALAFFCLGAGLFAETPGPSVRFTVFSARPVGDIAFVPREGATPQKLAFQSTARSPRYEYRGAMPLRFVDAATGAVVAEANLPANLHDALLLFTPVEPVAAPANTARPALRYQIAVLDDSATQLSAGKLAVLNLSGLALSGVINKERVTLKPGLNAPLAVGTAAEINLTTSVKGRSHRAYANSVALRRNERALLILFPPYYKGSLEVQSRLLIDQPPGTEAAVGKPTSGRAK